MSATASRAIHFNRFGPPEVLEVVEVPKPIPGRGEALVRVKACALNGFELMIRKGCTRRTGFASRDGRRHFGRRRELRPRLP